MTKIRNFKIPFRTREMARWLKKERGLEVTPDLEQSIERQVKEARAWIEPAAVYTTLTRQTAEKTTAIEFPEKAIAVSIVAVSIGPALDDERQTPQADANRESLLAALGQEALAQSLQFAVRLIQEQAKDEDCEMTAPACAPDPQLAGSLAMLVGVSRIGITLESGAPLPPFARLAWLFWTPVGKGSAVAPSKAGRAEKVTA